jgi:hypothetical protein
LFLNLAFWLLWFEHPEYACGCLVYGFASPLRVAVFHL